MDERESAKILAINYVDYAPRTVAEVRRRLTKAQYEEDVIEDVIADLVRAELLDDTKFSADWVESRSRSKRLGRTRLAAELRQKGISRDEVDQALGDLDPTSELTAAMELAQKRIRAGEHPEISSPAKRAAAKRRLAAYLQRRGYKWEIIEKVFASIFENDD
jgi:regulatory protein